MPPNKNPTTHANGRPTCQNVDTYKDGPAVICRLPIDGESYDFSFSNKLVQDWEHPVPAVSNRGRTSGYHQQNATYYRIKCLKILHV